MLGRVIAVNALFTSTTGSLGQFRAGLFAAFIGVAPSALIGGENVAGEDQQQRRNAAEQHYKQASEIAPSRSGVRLT
jgi:hypothetical protein